MNYVIDIIFVLILLVNAFVGYRKGFIKTVFQLLINIASFIVAYILAKPVSLMFAGTVLPNSPKEVSAAVAYLIAFVILYIIAHIAIAIAANVLDLISKLPVLNFTNKALGVIMGVILGIVYACIFALVLDYGYPLFAEIAPDVFTATLLDNSFIFQFIHKLNLLKVLFDLINKN